MMILFVCMIVIGDLINYSISMVEIHVEPMVFQKIYDTTWNQHVSTIQNHQPRCRNADSPARWLNSYCPLEDTERCRRSSCRDWRAAPCSPRWACHHCCWEPSIESPRCRWSLRGPKKHKMMICWHLLRELLIQVRHPKVGTWPA